MGVFPRMEEFLFMGAYAPTWGYTIWAKLHNLHGICLTNKKCRPHGSNPLTAGSAPVVTDKHVHDIQCAGRLHSKVYKYWGIPISGFALISEYTPIGAYPDIRGYPYIEVYPDI